MQNGIGTVVAAQMLKSAQWLFSHDCTIAEMQAWVVIMTLFTYFFIPETKGLLIEDVHEVFAAHWFWKRVGAVVHHKVRRGSKIVR